MEVVWVATSSVGRRKKTKDHGLLMPRERADGDDEVLLLKRKLLPTNSLIICCQFLADVAAEGVATVDAALPAASVGGLQNFELALFFFERRYQNWKA